LRIRHETPEDSVADAPLEAPQRFLAGLALIYLLAAVSSAPGIRIATVETTAKKSAIVRNDMVKGATANQAA